MRCRPSSSAARVALLLGAAALLAVSAAVASASHRTIPRSSAPATARAINLRAGDLPTLNARPISIQQSRREAAAVASCSGASSPSDAFAVAISPEFASKFGQGGLVIGSAVAIEPTAAIVARDLAIARGQRAVSCAVKFALDALRASLPAGDTATAAAMRIPSIVSGTNGSVALRLTITIRSTVGSTGSVSKPATKTAVFVDEFSFGYGQARVSLAVESVLTPPPSSLEPRLEMLLLARARSSIG